VFAFLYLGQSVSEGDATDRKAGMTESCSDAPCEQGAHQTETRPWKEERPG
jgi:hypothetical protein